MSSAPQTTLPERERPIARENAAMPKPDMTTGKAAPNRVRVAGKFFFVGEEKFFVRGVTYGPFRPEADGSEYHTPEAVKRDFAQMARNGINAVRIYTVPPRWLLDAAEENGLRVFIGLPWEQHVAFLDDPKRTADIERRVSEAVRACAGHPAVMAYAIGNEIPSPLVRWYGHKRVENFLHRLYTVAKQVDPEGLVTYVNYPSTEYLELPFLDFISFNVYLEQQEKLQAYVARLQNIAGERPLLMAELGLDSIRNGEATQARSLDWQSRAIFTNGCAGLFVFAWTDEWFRGGHEIEDWDFGVTTRERHEKPALDILRNVYSHVPFEVDDSWPLISVVICSHNGSRTIREALNAVQHLEYPKFEVVVVDDGSKDQTAAIAREFNVHLITQKNAGLSAARNTGWKAAKGQIVAYLDDDAAPDPHWLHYVASVLRTGQYAGVGGPNIAFPNDNFVARCVDHAPGNPTYVLLTDREAEHLPGCNMAYLRACLEEAGGFDAQFRIAGDDVDLCWRIQERGWKLAFHAGAMVWHHRRNSVATYWKQQLNYGKAEAQLERKWPEKYNAVGHLTWSGRLYGKGFWQMFRWSQRRIYHGSWGTALFQSVYDVAPGKFTAILQMPEWYLLIGLLAGLSVVSAFYEPMRVAITLLAIAVTPPLLNAVLSARRSLDRTPSITRTAMTAFLHFVQPAARLAGRLRQGLTPWRRRGADQMIFPRPQTVLVWSEKNWQSAEQRLTKIKDAMRESRAIVVHGGNYDAWDLEVRGGMLGNARLSLVIEEHGDSKQLVRVRVWPMAFPAALIMSSLFALLGMVAALDLQWTAWALLNVPALLLLARTVYEAGTATAVIMNAIPRTLSGREKIVSAK